MSSCKPAFAQLLPNANILKTKTEINGTPDTKTSQSPGDPEITRNAVFSEKYRGVRQRLVIENLVPGRKNRVQIPLRNETGGELNFGKVVVSCGCMVIRAFEPKVRTEEQSVLELDVAVGTSGKVEERELRFSEINGEVWSVCLECRPIAIFEPVRPEFTVDGTPCSFTLKYSDAAIAAGLISPFSKSETPSLSVGQAIIDKVDVLRTEDGLGITLTPDSGRFGLKKIVVDSFELKAESFTVCVEVLFRNPKSIRIFPQTCLAQKLRGDGQRFVVLSELDLKQICWRGIDSGGARFDLDISERKIISTGEIFEILSTDDRVLDCRQIEIYADMDPEAVLGSIKVEHHQ